MDANAAYEVHLDIFEGPLDLLLYLIKKNDLDIHNIPIAEITREYLTYLELMKDLNLELAGEFLVTAATLMQIKAKMLLPTPPGEEEGGDPRQELIDKLLEYQKFQDAAKFLESQQESHHDVYFRQSPRFREDEKELGVKLFDLLASIRKILDRSDVDRAVIEGEEFPVESKIDKLLGLLENSRKDEGGRSYITVEEFFSGERKLAGFVACFFALLEMVRLQKVFARQMRSFGEIRIYKKEPETAAEEISQEVQG
ncbi:MAG: segregation/condensation protein A [Elusimicrobia bacterium]|nr:segregation/condensation protein A [Elusimicrobiota bacterium]